MKKASIFWFTGMSGTGKSTIAEYAKFGLENHGYNILILDGDVVREGIHLRRLVQPGIFHGQTVRVDDVAVIEGVEIEIFLVAFMGVAGQPIGQWRVIFLGHLDAGGLGDGGQLFPVIGHPFPIDRHAHIDEMAPIDLFGFFRPFHHAVFLEPVQALFGAELVL